MFGINSTEVYKTAEYRDATAQNCLLLLESVRGTLLGDPYFGNTLKRYLFDQNNYILKDIIIDTIYTQIVTFLPQIKVNRKDIKIIQDALRGKLICQFTAVSQIDFTLNTYSLNLLTNSDI
jgi:phage baseplate assembly protein W